MKTNIYFEKQNGKTILGRLLEFLAVWARGYVDEESSEPERDAWNIKTVSIQEAFRDDGVTPVTRVWFSIPFHVPPSLDMLIHKNREKVYNE